MDLSAIKEDKNSNVSQTLENAAMASPNTDQSSRWVFILNNYSGDFNYKEHFSGFEVVKRCVFGYEVAPGTGTPHLQGYLEFMRSYRISMCNRVLANAHWEKAVQNSLANYRYCIKDGNFVTVGDWSRELSGMAGNVDRVVEQRMVRPLSTPMIIASLLNPKVASQVKVCKEYSDRYNYYDRMSQFIKKTTDHIEFFEKYSSYLLYPWQYEVSYYF